MRYAVGEDWEPADTTKKKQCGRSREEEKDRREDKRKKRKNEEKGAWDQRQRGFAVSLTAKGREVIGSP
jgi:hypothetical protein